MTIIFRANNQNSGCNFKSRCYYEVDWHPPRIRRSHLLQSQPNRSIAKILCIVTMKYTRNDKLLHCLYVCLQTHYIIKKQKVNIVNVLFIAFSSVMSNAQHFAVADICYPTFTPCSNMVGIHFFVFPNSFCVS